MFKEDLKFRIKKFLRFLSDKKYIKLYYNSHLKNKINMNNPKTLNEKIQWIKFNYRNPLMIVVSDKYLVRKYVADKIGDKFLIPLIKVWDNVSEIDFDELPNEFVLKCNHDSGGVVICKDKKELNVKRAKKKLSFSMKNDFYYIGREYQYSKINRKILCEKFIHSTTGNVPDDYKIYCFNGKADCILYCSNRFGKNGHKANYIFFDTSWNYLQFQYDDTEELNINIPKPQNLKEMINIAEKLSEDFLFARIDLYNIDGQIYFGEITLTPNGGFDPDVIYDVDLKWGNMLKIPYWDEIKHDI